MILPLLIFSLLLLLGPNYVVNSACAASTHALGLAYAHIAHGEADVCLAGGAEAAVTPFGYAGFCSMKGKQGGRKGGREGGCISPVHSR